MSIGKWLASIGMEEHFDLFERERITLDVLPHLTDDHLQALGVALGDRIRILAASAKASIGEAQRVADQRIAVTDAERRQLTVMFCDLVGSTRLSQKLDPEELRRLIRQYQDVCAGAVARYEGHVAQFLGDGVLVYFGYPKAHENEAERAIRAGLDIVARVSELSSEHNLQVRIGIDTGLVVIGQGEALNEQERTAIGDAPNVAARLQGLANPNSIIISERARQIAGKGFDYADLGTQELKGIEQPLHVFRVTGEKVVETRFDAATGGLAAPMVGREMELDIALKAWEKAKGCKQQVLLLCGEPGIGKSRILRAIRERITGDGAETWQYQCSPFFANTALYPTIANIERAAGFERNDSPESKRDKLEALLKGRFQRPDLDINLIGRLFNLPMEAIYGTLQMSPQKQKEETIRALIDVVHTAAKTKPLLVLFEDIHWADPTTLEELDLIIKRTDIPILWVLTYRPEFTPNWICQSHVTALTLNRLDATQTAQVATRVAGNKPLPKEIIEQIIQKTDGVPLFVEELTKAILETDLVRNENDQYVLTRQLTSLAIPATLHDSLMARLDRLHPTKEAAQIGACIGREFSHELLSLVSTQTPQQIATAIEQLLASELVFQKGDGTDAIYTFKHALVQDAAYESLLKSRRAEIHARIAATLEEHFHQIKDSEPETFAHHYTEAGMFEKAVPLWHKAGQIAVGRSSLVDAIVHLSHGLQACETITDDDVNRNRRVELLTTRGIAYMAMKGWPAAEVGEDLSAALPLARECNRADLLVPILAGLFWNKENPGPVSESFELVEEAFKEAKSYRDLDLTLVAHMLAVSANYWSGNLDKVVEHTESVNQLYNAESGKRIQTVLSHDPKGVAQAHCVSALWMLGYPDKAVSMHEDSDRHTARPGNYFDHGFALAFGSHIFGYRGDADRSKAIYERLIRIAREQNLVVVELLLAQYVVADAEEHVGRVEPAFRELGKWTSLWKSIGGGVMIPYCNGRMADALTKLGRFDEAFELVDAALEQIERPGWGERLHLAEILRIKGRLLEQTRRADDAEATYLASLDWAREQKAKSWELRTSTSYARLMQFQGRTKEAVELLKPVYDWFTEGFDTKDLKEAKGMLNELGAAA